MRKVFWNSQERALSTDLNREASFIEAEMSELFRALMDSSGAHRILLEK